MIEPIKAFYIFLVANFISALFAPIQDCDETFNYWEPTHYLSHGYGLQTWEYSPDYSIRSWSYVGLHAIVGNIRRLLPQSTKVYLVSRVILCENTNLTYRAARRVLLCSICPCIRLFVMPSAPISRCQLHSEPTHRALLPHGNCHVAREFPL